ncbi:phosphatase PAP2 family protein [Nocardia sp. XZ_19_385]|uniref:phosphatase PAP2 family protein n=1 Tax=Nocardia sp. XZ_19_385 TaxID=2769488 RepID=UPI00188E1088|nr:phosphatase PAP2 family protein [Nocardia sp. XZ_19_385]
MVSTAAPTFPATIAANSVWGVRIWLALILGVAAALVYFVTARTAAGQVWDQQVFLFARSELSVLSVPGWARIPWVSSPVLWIGVATLVTVFGVVSGLRWRTLVYLAFPPAAILLARVLRLVVLDRPELADAAGWAAANAAPSGHTTAAAASAVVLTMAAPRLVRPWVAVAMAGWVTLIGVQLVVAGWHRPGDVLLAILLVGALSAALPAPRIAHGALPLAITAVAGIAGGLVATWATIGSDGFGPKTTQAFVLIAVCAGLVVSFSATPAPGRSRLDPRAATGRGR